MILAWFGCIVQNGKLKASASCVLVIALNKVDFPIFGIPTIPHDPYNLCACFLVESLIDTRENRNENISRNIFVSI